MLLLAVMHQAGLHTYRFVLAALLICCSSTYYAASLHKYGIALTVVEVHSSSSLVAPLIAPYFDVTK
jgi:hypothetical protein